VALFPRITPTPFVAFGTKELGCAAGVMVTASHNTKEYNGYKVCGRWAGKTRPLGTTKVAAAPFTSLGRPAGNRQLRAAPLANSGGGWAWRP
jgi:phosphomannomutase